MSKFKFTTKHTELNETIGLTISVPKRIESEAYLVAYDNTTKRSCRIGFLDVGDGCLCLLNSFTIKELGFPTDKKGYIKVKYLENQPI